MSRDDDLLVGCLPWVALLVLSYVHTVYGMTGVVWVLGCTAALTVAWYLVKAARKARAERQRRARPCAHGVRGALGVPDLCPNCLGERAQAIRAEAVRQAEEDRRRRQEVIRRREEYLARIRLPEFLIQMDPLEFEELVCRLFEQMGYTVDRTPPSGDGGVDAYLRRDGRLTIVQCKRVKTYVGEPTLRDLYGTMHHKGAVAGIVVTTGRVSPQARAWMVGKAITVHELADLQLLIEQHIPGSDFIPPEFKPPERAVRLCPKCGLGLQVVKWKRKKFLGCEGFPACRYTRSLGR